MSAQCQEKKKKRRLRMEKVHDTQPKESLAIEELGFT